MTNYEVYFGTQERAIDSLSLIMDYPLGSNHEHPRPEVRAWQKEIYDTDIVKWLKMPCTNKRWWASITETKRY